MRKQERNFIVSQTLHDVARQAAGIRHDFADCPDLRALQTHPSCHDQSDIAGAQNHNRLAGQIPLQIDEFLRCSGCDHARGPGSRRGERAARLFSAAHHQHNCPRFYLKISILLIDRRNAAIRTQIDDHGITQAGDMLLPHHIFITFRVFRSGQLLMEPMQTETVMNTLFQDAAQTRLAFYDDNLPGTRPPRGKRCRHPCRATADNHYLRVSHCFAPPFSYASRDIDSALSARNSRACSGSSAAPARDFSASLAPAPFVRPVRI